SSAHALVCVPALARAAPALVCVAPVPVRQHLARSCSARHLLHTAAFAHAGTWLSVLVLCRCTFCKSIVSTLILYSYLPCETRCGLFAFAPTWHTGHMQVATCICRKLTIYQTHTVC